MHRIKNNRIYIIECVLLILITCVCLVLGPGSANANGDEASSSIRRYKSYEMSTGYYEEYEVLPSQRGFARSRMPSQAEAISYSPVSGFIRNRSLLADSHLGINFYTWRRCESCHTEQSNNRHSAQSNITCRQCHGKEPIAGIHHYYSPMNPLRRHAYVCAKCHEGANASFATYMIHEPEASSMNAKNEFPALYYTYWFMFILLTATLCFFIPHSFLAGIRELFLKKKIEKD